MSNDQIKKIIKNYQQSSSGSRSRQKYLDLFEKKMLYRTTKTENPTTTQDMVTKILNKINA